MGYGGPILVLNPQRVYKIYSGSPNVYKYTELIILFFVVNVMEVY